MQTFRFSVAICGREQTLTIRAAHLQRLIDGGYELLDSRGRAIAWLPGGMVIDYRVLPLAAAA